MQAAIEQLETQLNHLAGAKRASGASIGARLGARAPAAATAAAATSPTALPAAAAAVPFEGAHGARPLPALAAGGRASGGFQGPAPFAAPAVGQALDARLAAPAAQPGAVPSGDQAGWRAVPVAGSMGVHAHATQATTAAAGDAAAPAGGQAGFTEAAMRSAEAGAALASMGRAGGRIGDGSAAVRTLASSSASAPVNVVMLPAVGGGHGMGMPAGWPTAGGRVAGLGIAASGERGSGGAAARGTVSGSYALHGQVPLTAAAAAARRGTGAAAAGPGRGGQLMSQHQAGLEATLHMYRGFSTAGQGAAVPSRATARAAGTAGAAGTARAAGGHRGSMGGSGGGAGPATQRPRHSLDTALVWLQRTLGVAPPGGKQQLLLPLPGAAAGAAAGNAGREGARGSMDRGQGAGMGARMGAAGTEGAGMGGEPARASPAPPSTPTQDGCGAMGSGLGAAEAPIAMGTPQVAPATSSAADLAQPTPPRAPSMAVPQMWPPLGVTSGVTYRGSLDFEPSTSLVGSRASGEYGVPSLHSAGSKLGGGPGTGGVRGALLWLRRPRRRQRTDDGGAGEPTAGPVAAYAGGGVRGTEDSGSVVLESGQVAGGGLGPLPPVLMHEAGGHSSGPSWAGTAAAATTVQQQQQRVPQRRHRSQPLAGVVDDEDGAGAVSSSSELAVGARRRLAAAIASEGDLAMFAPLPQQQYMPLAAGMVGLMSHLPQYRATVLEEGVGSGGTVGGSTGDTTGRASGPDFPTQTSAATAAATGGGAAAGGPGGAALAAPRGRAGAAAAAAVGGAGGLGEVLVGGGSGGGDGRRSKDVDPETLRGVGTLATPVTPRRAAAQAQGGGSGHGGVPSGPGGFHRGGVLALAAGEGAAAAHMGPMGAATVRHGERIVGGGGGSAAATAIGHAGGGRTGHHYPLVHDGTAAAGADTGLVAALEGSAGAAAPAASAGDVRAAAARAGDSPWPAEAADGRGYGVVQPPGGHRGVRGRVLKLLHKLHLRE